MDRNELRDRLKELRSQWRAVRLERMRRKEELLASGCGMEAVRGDRDYRRLRKLQHRHSVRLAHLEKKLNRIRAREEKN